MTRGLRDGRGTAPVRDRSPPLEPTRAPAYNALRADSAIDAGLIPYNQPSPGAMDSPMLLCRLTRPMHSMEEA